MRFLKVIFVAIFIGFILAFIFYHNIKKDVQVFNDSSNKVYVFQAGVFKSINNAQNYAKSIDGSVIYHDNEYYRVFIGVLCNYEDIDLLKRYFDKKNINYFIKEMNINNIPNDFIKYENLLLETKQDKSIEKINQKMLDILLTYL